MEKFGDGSLLGGHSLNKQIFIGGRGHSKNEWWARKGTGGGLQNLGRGDEWWARKGAGGGVRNLGRVDEWWTRKGAGGGM